MVAVDFLGCAGIQNDRVWSTVIACFATFLHILANDEASYEATKGPTTSTHTPLP